MTAPASAEEIRDVNERYHDVAAAGYDTKWGIDFGGVGQAQVVEAVKIRRKIYVGEAIEAAYQPSRTGQGRFHIRQ